jgi:hypothetical protein
MKRFLHVPCRSAVVLNPAFTPITDRTSRSHLTLGQKP